MTDEETPARRDLRPQQSTFVLLRTIGPFVALGFVGLAAGIPAAMASLAHLGLVLLVVIGLAGVAHYSAKIAYTKERYTFLADRLICTRGTIFSDELTELEVSKITHVKLRLPWPRYRLFRVGDVMIESAGSGKSEIVLRCVVEPERVFEGIKELMGRNGFSLKQEQQLHEERPDPLGVAVECVGIAVSVAFMLVVTFQEMLIDVATNKEEQLPVLAVVAVVMALMGVVPLVLHYLDMRRRTYRVFSDVIVYEEGFLSRNNAFIPVENIADSTSKRTFLDRMLGLYDVGVSCQGSGSEIKFRRLKRGVALARAVESVVERHRAGRRDAQVAVEEAAATGEAGRLAPTSARQAREVVPEEEVWTGTLRMNMGRTVASWCMLCVVLFPLTPLWLLILLTQVIRAKVTTYEVRAGSVRSSYSFFSTSERDFSYDKITGVQVLENPLDRWFGTLSVELWSIGASLPIRLAHVKRADLNLPALLRQAGIPQESEPLTGIAAEYSIGTHVRSLVGLYAVTLLGVVALLTGAVVANPLFALGVLPLVVGLVALHLHATARYKRARVVFHPSHVDARDGLFWRDRTFVRYENLKKVVLTRYPFSDHGRARFLVAGERRIATNQGAPGQGQEAVIPYAFALGYLPDVRRKKTVLDGLFVERSAEAAARLSADEPCDPVEPLLESGPALGNALLQLVGISVLVFPAIALLPLTIPWTILATRRRRYQIDGDRILLSEGILYRTQSTILFERIDAIRCGQGFLGKLFKNGDVTILTAGSSKPDLVLKNCPDYQAFHAEIQRRYRAHPS